MEQPALMNIKSSNFTNHARQRHKTEETIKPSMMMTIGYLSMFFNGERLQTQFPLNSFPF